MIGTHSTTVSPDTEKRSHRDQRIKVLTKITHSKGRIKQQLLRHMSSTQKVKRLKMDKGPQELLGLMRTKLMGRKRPKMGRSMLT